MTARRGEVAATFAMMLLLTLAVHWPYFDLSKDISRIGIAPGERHTDLTPQFGPSSALFGEALARGSIAHWNPYILSGTPNLGNPQSRLIAVENFLNLFTRGQLSARLSIPIQMLIGWLGIFLLTRSLGFPSAYSLVVGCIYLFNPSYAGFHTATGHLNIINGITWAPWLAYLTVRDFRSGITRTVLLAVVLSLMIHGGASTITLYSAPALCVGYLAFHGARRGWTRSLLDLAGVAMVTAGLSYIKLAPTIDFMRVSDRAHGMSTALAFVGEAPFAARAAPALVVVVGCLVAVGIARLFVRSRFWFGMVLLSTSLGTAYIAFEPAFALARDTLPILGAVRIPSRALFLLYLEIGLLAALGLQQLADASGRYRWVMSSAAALVLLAGAYGLRPTPPTMVDGAALREANPVLQYVRRDDSFFRLTSYQDRDRNWGYQHQTIPYGIRTMLGYTPTTAHDLIHSRYTASLGLPQAPFLPTAFDNYATMVGLLSVKYVSSVEPLDEPGLRLLEELPLVHGPQPPKSRGPFLYLNERVLPRAYRGTQVVMIAGSGMQAGRTALDLLSDRRFDPKRYTLVAAPDSGPGAAIARTKAHLRLAPEALEPEVAGRATSEIIAALLLDTTAAPALAELPVEEDRPELLRIALPEATTGYWIVLSETFALFNGWTARRVGPDGAEELSLFRANHVNTAVWIPPGEAGMLELAYRSPGFRIGTVLLAMTTLGILLALLAPLARRRA